MKILFFILVLLFLCLFKIDFDLFPHLLLDSVISGILLVIFGSLINIFIEEYSTPRYLFIFGFTSYLLYRLIGIHDFYNEYGIDKHIKKKLVYNNPEIYNPAFM